MPDKKISELVNLTSLATDDEFVVVDKGANATKRITATNVSKFPAGVTVPDAGTIGSASDPDAMSIASGGVVTFSQGIKMAASKGIDFSAYGAGANIDSNLLDDYEEGTWTITNNGDATGTLNNTTGTYIKIGKFVLIKNNFNVTANFTSNIMSGLPFPVSNNNAGPSSLFGVAHVGNQSSSTLTLTVIDAPVNTIEFLDGSDASTPVSPTTTMSILRFAIMYITT